MRRMGKEYQLFSTLLHNNMAEFEPFEKWILSETADDVIEGLIAIMIFSMAKEEDVTLQKFLKENEQRWNALVSTVLNEFKKKARIEMEEE